MIDSNTAVKILSKNWLGVVAVILIIAIIPAVKRLFNSGISSVLGIGVDQRRDDFETALEDSINEVAITGYNLNHDNSYYKSMANRLYSGMVNWQPFFVSRFSSDLLDELKGLNADELKQITKEFGIKDKTNWMGLEHVITGGLIDWFGDELTGSEREEVKNIWAKTGLW